MRRKFDSGLLPKSPNLEFENYLWRKGLRVVTGLDEAGRGALAGPLYGAAVVLPCEMSEATQKLLSGVRDSKQLSAKQRDVAAIVVKQAVCEWSVGVVEAAEIDELGMGRAGRLVFRRALDGLGIKPEHLLIDYFSVPEIMIEQTALVKGDQCSLSIACASILAKTARDQRMRELAGNYPQYRFDLNKGYATRGHRAALAKFGACPEHRKSFQLWKLQDALF